jgi:hypothetical protein
MSTYGGLTDEIFDLLVNFPGISSVSSISVGVVAFLIEKLHDLIPFSRGSHFDPVSGLLYRTAQVP